MEMKSLVLFVATCLVFGVVGQSTSGSASGSTSLPACFLSMGDWGSVNEHVASIGRHMEAAVTNPGQYGCSTVDFIVALGDNFYPHGVISLDDPQWNQTFIKQFRSLLGLKNIPVYVTVGDHDYYQLNPQMQPNISRAQVQVDYSHKIDAQWILPDTNYTFTVKLGGVNVLVVALDTEALYTCLRLKKEWCFKGDQMDWFESVLSRADNDPNIDAIIAVGHHAIVCPLGGHYDPFIDDVVVPIGRKHRLSMYLTGHSHFLAWSSETDLNGTYPNGDMWYIINGAGRGAGAYNCYWDGLNFRVAKPTNKLCFSPEYNNAGGFMVHRVFPDRFVHCAVQGLSGAIVNCTTAPFRHS